MQNINRRNFNNRINQRQSPRKLIILGLLGILVVMVFPLIIYVYSINSSISNNSQTVRVKIESGDTRDQIASKLVDSNLINSENLYVWYTRISGKGGKVQAGNHILNKNMNIQEIVANLESKPDDTTVWVTIKEGQRLDEIAQVIEEEFKDSEDAVFDSGEYIRIASNPSGANLSNQARKFLDQYLPDGANLEGFLYPDTYNFKSNATAEEIISKQIETLESKISEDNWLKIQSSKFSFYEILIIASMLEREGRSVDEFQKIADIIERRLDMGMALGIDATTLYELKDWKAVITIQHLKANTPYNTRLNVGLPPTPIANPGIATINATINPESNDYLFYIHDNTGKIHYAKTNAEHEANVVKYLR